MNPKQTQRDTTRRAKEMHLNGASIEHIAETLKRSEEYIRWVITK